jgi:hypothetical protein
MTMTPLLGQYLSAYDTIAVSRCIKLAPQSTFTRPTVAQPQAACPKRLHSSCIELVYCARNLAGLSQELPKAVDKLTPDGRLPTEQEAARLV